MTEPDGKLEGAENEKAKLNVDDANTTTVELDLDESKAHLIKANANGGAGGDDHLDEYKTAVVDPATASSDGEVSFNGLGKDEVMKYANDPFWIRLRWILFILFWVGWLAMLVTAIAIIVLAPRCPPRPDLKWYHTDTVYQVFAKSFKDSNNDGVGDFDGVESKMGYLTGTEDNDLHLSAIWLSGIVKTDGSTRGVVDHKALDESFDAKPDQFRRWMKKLMKKGKKVIMDLIPNQTSKNHTWFLKSQQKDDYYKNFYVWHEGVSAPNNWKNHEGNPAWTLDPSRQAWYYHQFSSDYPDLNLNNPDVVKEIKDIMQFWMDAGVSGFHVQDVQYLVENPDISQDDDGDRTQTKNYHGTYELLEELRKVANAFSDKPGREKLLFATVVDVSANQTFEYYGPEDKRRLHIVAPLFDKLDASCSAECMKDMVEERLNASTDQWLGLQLGNENIKRIASRMADGTSNYKSRVMTAHALQLLLPGTPFNYYGDEFGQKDGTPSSGDDMNIHRTPMQWNGAENAGFTNPGIKPWQPVGPGYEKDNVEAQQAHFAGMTPWETFQNLVELRKKESFQWGKTQICAPQEKVLLFTRKATRFPFFLTVINLSDQDLIVRPQDLDCVPRQEEGIIKFHSGDRDEVSKTLNFAKYALHLRPYEILVVEFSSDD